VKGRPKICGFFACPYTVSAHGDHVSKARLALPDAAGVNEHHVCLLRAVGLRVITRCQHGAHNLDVGSSLSKQQSLLATDARQEEEGSEQGKAKRHTDEEDGH
jgi:hypothetical protein